VRILLVTLGIVIIDQLSKVYVKSNFYYGERVPVIGDFFRFTFVENPGLAFGIDITYESRLFLIGFSILATLGLLYFLYKSQSETFSFRLGLAMIIGGAIGNLIDRIFYGVFFSYGPLFEGNVVDFFDMDFFNLALFGLNYDRFAIFNVADVAVSVGVVWLVLFYRPAKTPEELHQSTPMNSDELGEAFQQNSEELPNENNNNKSTVTDSLGSL